MYAAMYLDKKLARRPDVEATLISRENFFLFTPMLHEVAGGDLYPADIVNPIRRIIRHIKFVEAEVQATDLAARRIRCVAGAARLALDFEFHHLLIAPGSETNYFDLPGVSEWAVTMKTLTDAARLRERVLGLLEQMLTMRDVEAMTQMAGRVRTLVAQSSTTTSHTERKTAPVILQPRKTADGELA